MMPLSAGHFLHMLSGDTPSELFEQVMNVSLILYAEHEFNASTFTARVCASTLSDMHSCITAAIGSLRGPLHGGANEAAMEMIEDWTSAEQAESGNNGYACAQGQDYGLRSCDLQRVPIRAIRLSRSGARNSPLKSAIQRCIRCRCAAKKLCGAKKSYSATPIFSMLPPITSWAYQPKLFTPIFVMSRLTGWAAHVKEQRANNRIIRPSADYTGPETSTWVDIADR